MSFGGRIGVSLRVSLHSREIGDKLLNPSIFPLLPAFPPEDSSSLSLPFLLLLIFPYTQTTEAQDWVSLAATRPGQAARRGWGSQEPLCA